MDSLNDSGEFQEVESNHSGSLRSPVKPAVIPSSCSMRSRECLPLDTWNTSGPQEHVFGNQFSTVDSSRNHYQRIHHSMTPGDTGSVPVHIGRTSHGIAEAPADSDDEERGYEMRAIQGVISELLTPAGTCPSCCQA